MKHYLNDLIVVLACCITVTIVTFIESDRVDDLEDELIGITRRLEVVEQVLGIEYEEGELQKCININQMKKLLIEQWNYGSGHY